MRDLEDLLKRAASIRERLPEHLDRMMRQAATTKRRCGQIAPVPGTHLAMKLTAWPDQSDAVTVEIVGTSTGKPVASRDNVRADDVFDVVGELLVESGCV